MIDRTKLSTGTQSFPALREYGQIYVDKTAMINEIARGRTKVFFARPRRFGKSLLVSTLATLFENGLRDFEGLAIEKLWTDTTYLVFHLDFSVIVDFDTVEDFREKFFAMLTETLKEHGFAWSGNEKSFSYEFSSWLKMFPNSSLVVLIDEYDSPLTRVLNDKALFAGIQKIMSEFFMILKNRETCFRFMFFTGITRLSNTTIFSGFNNLTDISLDPDYGTLVGYTEDELKKYFGDYLEVAAEKSNVSPKVLLDLLREYYDGFSFDKECKTHVYCPWSVLNYLGSKRFQFENYWFQSGGQPNVLMNYLAMRKLNKPLDFLETVSMDASQLMSSAPYDKLDVDVLLHQTGYLTIRGVDEGGGLLLGYPNREVAASMALLYAKVMVSDEQFTVQKLLTNLMRGEVDKVMDFVNGVFHSLDYQNYAIRDEASLQGCMQILMIGLSLRPQVEVHTARGRSDMEVEVGDKHWVFEFKFARNGVDPNELCREAVDRILQRDYGNTLHGKQLIRVAMVFEAEKRQVTVWEVL